MTSETGRQKEVCRRYGAPFFESPRGLKVGIARNVRDGLMPINGLRHPPEGDTTGWYIWAGEELPSDPDFFVPLHVEHIAEWCPEALPFLGLPPGWRFLVAPGHDDVWEDESLLNAAGPMNRQRVLRSLLELQHPVDQVVDELSGLPWDSEKEIVMLRPHHIIDVLRRFKSQALSAEEVESWANAVEGRDDIGFEDKTQQVLKAVLFDLANPELQGVLSPELADQGIKRLREAMLESNKASGPEPSGTPAVPEEKATQPKSE